MEWATALEAMPLWEEVAAKQIHAASKAEKAGDSTSSTAPVLPDMMAVQTLPPRSKGEGWHMMAYVLISQQADSSPSPSGAGEKGSRVRLRVLSLPSEPSSSTRRTLAKSAAQEPKASDASESWMLTVGVPGYNVDQSGPFQQVLLASGGLGLLLMSPLCVAFVRIPEFHEKAPGSELITLSFALLPPPGVTYVKVLWHPLSDGHCGVLLSNSQWQLLDLRQRSDAAPEVHITVTFGAAAKKRERATDFVFAGPGTGLTGGMPGAWGRAASDAVWLAVTVIFLSATGKVSMYCPVLPGLSVFPKISLDVLRTSVVRNAEGVMSSGVVQWLEKTLLSESACRPLASVPGCDPGAMVSVKHFLHLQGEIEEFESSWLPAEQVVLEEDEAKSPRGLREYCSLHLATHAPITVVVRASTSGLLEALIINGPIEPRFEGRARAQDSGDSDELVGSVFEEIDLKLSQAKAIVRLVALPSWFSFGSFTPPGTAFLARTRELVAAVNLAWLADLMTGSEALDAMEPSKVATVDEVRSASSGVGVGFQLCIPPPGQSAKDDSTQVLAALWMRSRATGSDTPAPGGRSPKPPVTTAHALDISARLDSTLPAGKAKDSAASLGLISPSKDGKVVDSAQPRQGTTEDRKEYLRYLRVPTLLGRSHIKEVFSKASATKDGPPAASAVVQAVADVHEGALAELLSRQVVLKHLIQNAPKRAASAAAELCELQVAGKEVAKHAAEAQRVAQRIAERQKELEELQSSVTGALADEVERQALDRIAAEELPGLWMRLHGLRRSLEELRIASVSLDDMEEALQANLSADHLASLEELQRSWTEHSTEQLTLLAAEAAVAKAVQHSAGSFPFALAAARD